MDVYVNITDAAAILIVHFVKPAWLSCDHRQLNSRYRSTWIGPDALVITSTCSFSHHPAHPASFRPERPIDKLPACCQTKPMRGNPDQKPIPFSTWAVIVAFVIHAGHNFLVGIATYGAIMSAFNNSHASQDVAHWEHVYYVWNLPVMFLLNHFPQWRSSQHELTFMWSFSVAVAFGILFPMIFRRRKVASKKPAREKPTGFDY